ncbi:unnamed protein product [Discosporangium mesarthrocarpum]
MLWGSLPLLPSQLSTQTHCQEAERMLIARIDALERMVYPSKLVPGGSDLNLVPRVQELSRGVSRASRGNDDLQHVSKQASALGLLDPRASFSPGSADTLALKESALLAAKDEVERIASLLAQVNALEKHINPPYLGDIPNLSKRLVSLEAIHLGQASETAMFCERAEQLRLNYGKAISLVSEKFVYYDDQLVGLEQEQRGKKHTGDNLGSSGGSHQ